MQVTDSIADKQSGKAQSGRQWKLNNTMRKRNNSMTEMIQEGEADSSRKEMRRERR